MNKIRNTIFALIIIFVFSSAFAADSIMVQNAWIRSAPPNAKVLAAYMVIRNNTDESRTLTSISGKLFRKVELHRTEMREDMMKMVRQKHLNIPAGGSVALEPGGYHLMLLGPLSVLKSGDIVNLELHFDNGRTLNIDVPVREEDN